jgi:hypothetical protein
MAIHDVTHVVFYRRAVVPKYSGQVDVERASLYSYARKRAMRMAGSVRRMRKPVSEKPLRRAAAVSLEANPLAHECYGSRNFEVG